MDEFMRRSIERGTRGIRQPSLWLQRGAGSNDHRGLTNDKAMAVVLLTVGGRTLWLLIERPFEGNRLTFPGGDVTRNETPLFGAVRETWEETGLDLSEEATSAELIGKFPLGGRRGDIYVYFFKGVLLDLKGLRSSGEGVVTLLTIEQLLAVYNSNRLTENGRRALELLLAHQHKKPTA